MNSFVEGEQQFSTSLVINLSEGDDVWLRLDGQPSEADKPDFSVGSGGLLNICGAEIEVTPVGKSREHIDRAKDRAANALAIDLLPYFDCGRLPPDRQNKELVRKAYEWGIFVPRKPAAISEEDRLLLMEVGPHILQHDKQRDIRYTVVQNRQANGIDSTLSKVEVELLGLRKRCSVGTLGLVTLYLAHKTLEQAEQEKTSPLPTDSP